MDAEMDVQRSTPYGRFRYESFLGGGAFGDVHKVHSNHRKSLTLKFYDPVTEQVSAQLVN